MNNSHSQSNMSKPHKGHFAASNTAILNLIQCHLWFKNITTFIPDSKLITNTCWIFVFYFISRFLQVTIAHIAIITDKNIDSCEWMFSELSIIQSYLGTGVLSFAWTRDLWLRIWFHAPSMVRINIIIFADRCPSWCVVLDDIATARSKNKKRWMRGAWRFKLLAFSGFPRV